MLQPSNRAGECWMNFAPRRNILLANGRRKHPEGVETALRRAKATPQFLDIYIPSSTMSQNFEIVQASA